MQVLGRRGEAADTANPEKCFELLECHAISQSDFD
jgi:hypothetical protein